MSHFQVEGRRLFYRQRGSGPLLVLVHNGFLSSASWEETIDRLAGDYLCVAWDRLGYGRSSSEPKPDATLEDGIAELDALLFHLESQAIDTSQFFMAGHCFGGALAARWTARNPGRLRALVLEATGFWSDPQLRTKAQLMACPWAELPDSLRQSLSRMHGRLNAPAVWQAIMDWNADYILAEGYDLRPELAAIECPCLVCNATDDPYFKPEHAQAGADCLIQATLWQPEGPGHDIHERLGEEFAQRLESLFSKA